VLTFTVKLIGAMCVIASCAAVGLSSVFKLRRHAKTLAVVRRSLGTIRAELTTRLTPLPELFARLATDADEPFRTFAATLTRSMNRLGEVRFSELWVEAVDASNLGLLPDELAVLRDLGRVLGRYELDEQRAYLQYAEERISEFTLRAEHRRDADSKPRAAVAVACGVILTLIML
jgi:stage III sporulation protein AB